MCAEARARIMQHPSPPYSPHVNGFCRAVITLHAAVNYCKFNCDVHTNQKAVERHWESFSIHHRDAHAMSLGPFQKRRNSAFLVARPRIP